MHKHFKISVDGRAYDVIVEEIASDGTAPMPAAPVVAASAVARAEAFAAPSAPPPPVAAGAGSQVAPLGGVIDSIAVTVGTVVAVGDLLAVIEAMKMKTEILARVSGTVAAIPVQVGQAVDAGAVLVEIA